MKKFFSTIIALLAVATAGNADEIAGLNVGYCDGQVWTQTNQAFGSTQKNIWVSGAIYLPAGDVNVYGGNRIEQIRAGLAQKLSIDTLCVWVRASLDGDNLAQGGIPKSKVVKGWNEVTLDTPYELDGKNQGGLYVGYSYHQTGSNYGLSVIPVPTPNALFVKVGDEQWRDRSDEGLLCLEALVYGESLPKLNLKLTSLQAPANYVIERGTMTVTGTVKNMALQTVTGFDVETRFDGLDDVYTAHVDLELAYGDEKEFQYTIQPTAIKAEGKSSLTATITRLNEGDDENPDDNVGTGDFYVVQRDFTRHVLIEEFTGEQCTNCPRVAAMLHDLLDDKNYQGNVSAVCHHVGYYPDWLTTSFDADYLWYFNSGGSTYAPAIMIDRRTPDGESTPVGNPASYADLKAQVNKALSQSAFVSVVVDAELDTLNNVVNVTVSGARSKEDITANPARITVWLVEDNINAHNQAGASGSYVHQHTNRMVNSTWGETVQWDGDDYTYTCSFNLRADYKKPDLLVTAMIYNYDADSPKRHEVANAGTARVTVPGTDGINAVTATAEGHVSVYDLQGRRVSQTESLRPGIYVVNGQKRVVR